MTRPGGFAVAAVCAVVGMASCGGAHAPATKQAAAAARTPAPPPARVDVPPVDPPLPLWPEVHTGVLPNGLTYFILKHGKPQKRVLLWLAVNAGSILEDPDQRGLAHFAEHMAFDGTKRFPRAAIVDYVEKIGMRFGADLNAYTNFDETVYKLEVPTDGDGFVTTGLDILRDWAGDVIYDPAQVENERGVVLEEWRLGLGASKRLFDKQAPVLFKGSRYAERLTIGLPDTIKSATRDVLHRFYADWYRPDLMAVIVVGDIDPAQIQAEIEKRFADLKGPATPRPRVRGEVPVADGTRVSIETDRESTKQTVAISNLVAHRPHVSASDFRRTVDEALYAIMLDSRFTVLAHRPDAPFVSARGHAQALTREIDAFERTATIKGDNAEAAVRALVAEVMRVDTLGFTASELDRARAQLERRYTQAETRASTTESRAFTAELVRHFLEHESMTGAAAEQARALALLPMITLDEVNGVARSFGGDKNRVVVLSGPDGKPLPTQARVLAIIDEVEHATPEPWDDTAPRKPLMSVLPTAGTIVSEKTVDAIGVTEWTLSNGAHVIVKPSDFEADSVSVVAYSPGGLSMATDQEFASARFAGNVAVGGVADLDADDIKRALAAKTAAVNAVIGDDTETVVGHSSAHDVESMMQLLNLRMTSPRRDEQAWTLWKSNESQRLTDAMRNPEHSFQIDERAALYKHNPRAAAATAADVEHADLDKALAFYTARFGHAAGFTFVIVGIVDLATLRPLVERYLASLPSGKPDRDQDVKLRKVGGVVSKTWTAGEAPKAFVHLEFHGDEPWSRDREHDIAALSHVLGIRLREVLREEMGGVYDVRASGLITRSPHPERTFTISFGCAPENVDKLIAATRAEIAAIAKAGIGEDYLEKTKQGYLREIETLLRKNTIWSAWLAAASRYGDDLTLILDSTRFTARVTSANVKASANRYLDPKTYFQAVLLPASSASTAPPPRPSR